MSFGNGKGKQNPGGQALVALPPRPFEAALKRALIQENSHRLRKMAEQVLDLAAAGEQWAIQFVADRLDGKPKQVISGENGETPVFVQSITYNIVDATKTTNRDVTPPKLTRIPPPQPIAANGVVARARASSDVMAPVRRSA